MIYKTNFFVLTPFFSQLNQDIIMISRLLLLNEISNFMFVFTLHLPFLLFPFIIHFHYCFHFLSITFAVYKR